MKSFKDYQPSPVPDERETLARAVTEPCLLYTSCSAYGILASEGIAKSEYQDVFFRCIDTNITTPGFTARTTQMFDRAIKSVSYTHLFLSLFQNKRRRLSPRWTRRGFPT